MIFRHIGVAGRHQALDQRLHLAMMLGRARLDRRAQAAERIDILVELPLGLFGHEADRLVERQARIFLRRPRVDLVVDVSDVAHVGDVLGAVEMPQQPEQHIEHDHRPRIADMGEVVDRGPAHIHAHAIGIERLERPLLARERIVKAKLHRSLSHALDGALGGSLGDPAGGTPPADASPLAGASLNLEQENKDGRSQRGCR